MAPLEYRIRFKGHLAPEWAGWFEGLAVQCQPDGTTVLSGPVRDQAALHGLLIRVRDLGLSLVAVTPSSIEESTCEAGDQGG